MEYKPFGRTGLQISQLSLGTGTFGTGWVMVRMLKPVPQSSTPMPRRVAI